MNKVLIKREKKKYEIINSAVKLFTEKGFENVSLLDIAQSNNMGRTTIYEYFQNKNEILAAFLIKEMNIYHEKITGILEMKQGIRNKLREIIIVGLEYANHHQGFQQLFQALSRSNDDMAIKTNGYLKKLHHELYRSLSAELIKAMNNKQIREITPELFVQLLFNITASPVRTSKSIEETADEFLSVIWSGIK